MEWVIQLPVLFFSVVVHEFCHGWVAYSRGDDTAEKQGRLTLNPTAHVDPFGTVFLPLLCFVAQAPMFGWAKPVPVDSKQLDRPLTDMMKVAAAGPAANIALAFLAAVAFKLMTLSSLMEPAMRATVLEALLFAVTLNLFLAFFNLIPVHPLDGSKVLSGLLPKGPRAVYARHAPYGLFIIVALLLTKGLSALVTAPMSLVLGLWTRMGLLG